METVFFGKSIKGFAWPRSLNHFLLNLLRNTFGDMLNFHVSYKNTCQICLYIFESFRTQVEIFHGMHFYGKCLEIFEKDFHSQIS